MKRLYYALMLVLGLSISGCEKEDRIRVTSEDSLTFQSEGSSETITIISNVPWKASTTESWIELSPASGAAGNASITVTAKENESTDERNASVTISGGTASVSVKITQKQNVIHTKIFYTSTDGKTVEPKRLKAWSDDAIVINYTNTYGENGGVIEFLGKVDMIDLSYGGITRLLSFDGISNMVYLYKESGKSMFSECSSVKTIDVSNFNTENVVDMQWMFSGCSSLKALDLSSFNTEKVMFMGCMFQNCSSLQSLDLSSFNTENVMVTSYMFSGCSSLQSLDVSSFNTEDVTDMSCMFQRCSSLQSLDLSSFNTENVTQMEYMFRNCSSIQSLDLSGFNTENVTQMNSMFYECSSIKTLDVSNFNTKNVTEMSFMFSFCSSLQSIDLSSFNTENVTDMVCMFQNCSSLQSLDLSSFNTKDDITHMDSMFLNCSSLQNIKAGEKTNKGKINPDTFKWIKSNGILYYPQGCDYSEWLSDKCLGAYGWTGQEY